MKVVDGRWSMVDGEGEGEGEGDGHEHVSFRFGSGEEEEEEEEEGEGEEEEEEEGEKRKKEIRKCMCVTQQGKKGAGSEIVLPKKKSKKIIIFDTTHLSF